MIINFGERLDLEQTGYIFKQTKNDFSKGFILLRTKFWKNMRNIYLAITGRDYQLVFPYIRNYR